MKRSESRIVRILLMMCGHIFVVLGIIGIILPVMPGTVFFILATACYIRSSEKMYLWLINNKWFGRYAKLYLEERSMPLKAKLIATISMWTSISISIYYVDRPLIRLILLATGICVTIYFISLKTTPKKLSKESIKIGK